MRQSGLSYRFSEKTRAEWIFWYSCLVCWRNQWSALHHIVSPSSRFHVKGKHNESVYNSCPIHNFGCHIDNEAFLYSDDTIKMLLNRSRDALIEMGYKPNALDREFLQIYSDLYA